MTRLTISNLRISQKNAFLLSLGVLSFIDGRHLSFIGRFRSVGRASKSNCSNQTQAKIYSTKFIGDSSSLKQLGQRLLESTSKVLRSIKLEK